MQNREAFIDFVHGLLNISPLERWSPQQARTHPFITQQKYTAPFQPRMDLKSSSRSPAPGVQQQQQAEAVSRQRAQQAQAQHAQQAANAAYAASMHSLTPGYPSSPSVIQTPQAQIYAGMYSPSHQGAPPPYPASANAAFGQGVPTIQQPPPVAASVPMHAYAPQQQQQQQVAQQNNLYAQATTRAGRQRASTMDGNGIPASLQRVVSHLDPNAPIRLQPSPAYYPPPSDGQEPVGNVGGRRRTSRARQGDNRNFIRALEDRTLEEGWSGEGHEAGNPAWHSTYGAV